jgi:hypothetical protein
MGSSRICRRRVRRAVEQYGHIHVALAVFSRIAGAAEQVGRYESRHVPQGETQPIGRAVG